MSLARIVCLIFLVLPLQIWSDDSVDAAAELLKSKDPAAAEAINALVQSQPKNADVRVLEARLRLQQGQAEEAIDAAKLAVKLAPENAQAHYWLGNGYGTRIGQVGLLSQATMAPKMRNAYLRAIELDPDLNGARSSLVEFYLQAPAIAGGGVDHAMSQAQELLHRDPPRGHYALGRIALHEEKPAEAAREFAIASAARPEDDSFRMMTGLALQQDQQWDEAFAWFEAWTQQAPGTATAWYQLGRTSALSGQRLEEGAAALEHFLTLPIVAGQPQPQHAWYRLGQIQVSAGDKPAAKRSFQSALKADPDYKDAKTELAKL
jgi:predicted Zn-dependent protease